MTAVDFTLSLFCRVNDVLPEMTKHPLSKLYPSEVVTLGVWRALRGGSARHFDRWLRRELGHLLRALPERSRLTRLLAEAHPLCVRFLGRPTLFALWRGGLLRHRASSPQAVGP